jgi:hypothetical protein
MARRRRDGFGFWGPFPSWSRQTRRGSVRVSGCCLPTFAAMVIVPVLGARQALRRG